MDKSTLTTSKRKVPFVVKSSYLTVFTVIAWVIFDVLRILTTKPDPKLPEHILKPLDAKIDIKVLQSLKERIYFNEEELISAPIVSPTISPKPTEATSEAQTTP